ncbi:hypothetical protein [Streptomyces parvus]|uniref:Uncharacterized protein n=1 Tax=Streptomyces parvus TaxID=66428 RepID=A0A7K3RXH3_9ACTN|nr:hypothetical protein [Streptomyces parvus]NEC19934.1 hypothetical protein [Streptomyces parvus]
MRRRTIGQALVTASALVAGMLATLTPATAAEQPSPPSAQEYLSWLAEQDDPGAARTATEFKALSEVDTNYNVGVSISHEPEDQWISGAGNALAYVTWHGNTIYKGFGVSLDKRHHLRCDETGLRYHYLKNV